MAMMWENYSGYWTLYNAFIVGIASTLTLVIGQFIYNVYFHPLANFPGPLLWRGSNIPKIMHQIHGDIHTKMLEMHQQYGPVVRLAPDELTYTSATALHEIYGNRSGKKSMPPQITLGKNDQKMFGATSFVWLPSHTEHARHRKILAKSFSEPSLAAQEPILIGYADLLVAQLRERAARGDQVVDLWAWFNYLTFDMIGDLTFGEPFDCVKDGQFHPWISFIFTNLTTMMYAQIIATLGTFGALIEALIPARIWAEAISHAQATRDKVDRRLARNTTRPDFVTGFTKHINAPGGISSAELYADSNIFLMAGSETSATLLAVAVYYLLRNPAKLALLQDEVRAAFGSVDEVRFASVGKLEYLLAVVNESLRIHPPLPAGINRVVPVGGAVIDGQFVAEGTVLQVPHWATFHLEENFTDPWEFVPERFLSAAARPARFAGDNYDVFQPFSYGDRNCIGRSLAYVEVKVTLCRMLLAFDMELMPQSLDWNEQRVFLLWEKRPLYVKLTERVEEKVLGV